MKNEIFTNFLLLPLFLKDPVEPVKCTSWTDGWDGIYLRPLLPPGGANKSHEDHHDNDEDEDNDDDDDDEGELAVKCGVH